MPRKIIKAEKEAGVIIKEIPTDEEQVLHFNGKKSYLITRDKYKDYFLYQVMANGSYKFLKQKEDPLFTECYPKTR